MIYDLWDVESGNLIETFETEADALKAVSELLALNSPDYVHALSLGYEDSGQRGHLAHGQELAARAHQRLTQSSSA